MTAINLHLVTSKHLSSILLSCALLAASACVRSRNDVVEPEQGPEQTAAPGATPTVPTGPRSTLQKDWTATAQLTRSSRLLVMAGHADAQNLTSGAGAGTGGAAVGMYGAQPMDSSMTDELFWALEVARKVAAVGAAAGLNIRFYDPPSRSIENANDPRTCWSVGKAHADAGGYAFEIHFDAYGKEGFGSGLIPSIPRPTNLDEALAAEFGAYPKLFRNGLGGPTRGVSILEIGKLEGPLEAALRDPKRRSDTVTSLATRVVRTLQTGFGK
jgi:hypothetical protein